MKNALGNPALLAAAANTPAGQRVLETASKSTAETFSIVKNVVLIGVVGGLGYVAYKKFINGFSSLGYNSQYMPTKISRTLAKAKADSIYNSMYGVSILKSPIINVIAQLKELNHNDILNVYNQFGGRQGINDVFKQMNMFEWFGDQFNDSDLAKLRFSTKVGHFI